MSPFEPFKQLVEAYSGLEFTGIAEQRLQKEVSRNSARLGGTLQDYFTLISGHAESLGELVNQLTVNETYFYREPEQIHLFVRTLFPRLQAVLPEERPVRILSVGCSSGEEPYSLAMALCERWGRPMLDRVQIDAGDLDEDILAKARAGIYSPFSFRALDDHLRDKYFQADRRGYQIKDDIRRAVRFFSFNLKADVYPAEPGYYDAVFFRNVSIYFSLTTRRDIQRKLRTLMGQHGVLLLGSSETLGNDFGIFGLQEEQGQYYFVLGPQGPARPADTIGGLLEREPGLPYNSVPVPLPLPEPSPEAPIPASVPDPLPFSVPVERPAPADHSTELEQLKDRLGDTALHTGVLQRLERILQSEPGNLPALLMKGWVLLNRKDFARARLLLDQVLERDSWCFDALIAVGLCQKWQAAADEALQSFRKACYSHPESWLAHYYLADMQKQLDQPAAAQQSFQVVRRILSNNIQAPSACTWLPLALPVKDVLFLAERSLLALRQQPEQRVGGS